MKRNYDVIIVGGGPSGITAALAAGRANVSALLIERYGFLVSRDMGFLEACRLLRWYTHGSPFMISAVTRSSKASRRKLSIV